MAISQWMDELLLGLEPFDSEHKILFQLIDDLNEAMKARLGDVVIDSILGDLENYARTHFQHEEEYFLKIAYPRQAEHSIEHLKFTNDIAGFRQELFQSPMGLPVKVVNYLRNWLYTHIKVKDKDFGYFARQNGWV